MANRPFAYVCSPFRGDVEKNAERAREYCRKVFDAGYAPIAPHLYFPQFVNDEIPKEREAGMAMGTALLPLCRVIVICGDEFTEGMRLETAAARRLGIPIYSLGIFLEKASQWRSAVAAVEKSSVLRQIAEVRAQGAPSDKPKPGKPRKSRGEEL
jgi:dienelactone hydrolase